MPSRWSLCAALLLLAVAAARPQAALAQDDAPPPPATDPTVKAAGGPVADALGAVDSTVGAGGRVIGNAGIAATSAANAVGEAAGLATSKLGALLAPGKLATDHYLKSFGLLNDIIRTVNSINIAGTNVAVGAAGAGLNTLVDNLQSQANAVAGLSLDLVNEFGRAVGNGVQALSTLSGPLSRISPVGIGFELLQHNLQGLVAFLQGVGDVSVAGPGQAAALAPFITKFQLLNTMLTTLQGILQGPHAGVIDAVDGALGALGAPGDAPGVTMGALGSLVDQAMKLLGPFLGQLTNVIGR